jgi:hypothetical protein
MTKKAMTSHTLKKKKEEEKGLLVKTRRLLLKDMIGQHEK